MPTSNETSFVAVAVVMWGLLTLSMPALLGADVTLLAGYPYTITTVMFVSLITILFAAVTWALATGLGSGRDR